VQGIHFLEHLPNVEVGRQVVLSAAQVARELCYFRQPYFDADEYLSKLGLKLYWSDWHGHPSHVTTEDLEQMALAAVRAGTASHYWVLTRGRIATSGDAAIHPWSSPRDQGAYDSNRHPAKADVVEFTIPVYRESILIMAPGPTPLALDALGECRKDHLVATSMSSRLLRMLGLVFGE
jgi:hypothetical protein